MLVDPGDCAAISGTTEDFLVPNACLNATVAGLVSRTIVAPDLVGPHDFHAAKYYPELCAHDRSAQFLDTISHEFPAVRSQVDVHHTPPRTGRHVPSFAGERIAQSLADEYDLPNVNLVKAGVSETVRMLLHRPAQRVLVQPDAGSDIIVVHQLATRWSLPIEERPDAMKGRGLRSS